MLIFVKIFEHTMNTVTYKGLTFRSFITAREIADRIEAIAADITERYRGLNPLLVCVLNGAFPFAADLFRALDCDAEIAFVRLSSYAGTESTGEVRQVIGLTEPVDGRYVIVVEDIIDTGCTMQRFLVDLRAMNPAGIEVATLLFKPESLKADLQPDYVGFTIPPKFIIGFGLDLDGQARNLRDIYVLADED